MKRILSLTAATLLVSAAPALAQTSVEGGVAGEGSAVIQQQDDSATGEAGAAASGSALTETTETTDPAVTGSIDLSTEQQTEMRTLLSEGATPAEGEFEITVGAMAPDTVTVQTLPPRFVEVVPQYEGYRYFVLADGRVVIVEPDSLEVVYILS